MDVTVNCVVKNEDKWVWFAINSVLPYVKKVLVYDTGSTDKTVEIIKTIKSEKLELIEKGGVDSRGLVRLRQEQLEKTETEWLLILDGDEIWPSSQLAELFKKAESCSKSTIAFINNTRNCVGDVFHYLPDNAGEYNIAGYTGNLNIRLIRKTKDLKVTGEYPLEVYTNKNGPIQNQEGGLMYTNNWCLHTTFLKRSSLDKEKKSGSFGKKKYWEKGITMDENDLPVVLILKRPDIVDPPIFKRGLLYEFFSALTSPLLKLKRLFK